MLGPLNTACLWFYEAIVANQLSRSSILGLDLDVLTTSIIMDWLKVLIKWSLADLVANRLLPCTC